MKIHLPRCCNVSIYTNHRHIAHQKNNLIFECFPTLYLVTSAYYYNEITLYVCLYKFVVTIEGAYQGERITPKRR
ncbi:hypothetical protein VDIAB_100181 [Vibrio diabolicus]|nr:hypothetical protein VDIAB_100181 [Vibrio diabolicus]